MTRHEHRGDMLTNATAIPTIDQNAAACPVYPLVQEIAAVISNFNALERAMFKATDVVAKAQLRERADRVEERSDAIEDEVSWRRATSVSGAMFQLMLAILDTRNLENWAAVTAERAKNRENDDEIPDKARHLAGRIDRCLHSALGVLAATSGVSPSEVGGGYYLSPENPFDFSGAESE